MASDPSQTAIKTLPQLPGVAPAAPTEETVAVTSPSGVTYQVPQSQMLEVMSRGFRQADPSKLAEIQTGARIAEEQAGVLPALLTGVEAGASAITFGATDYAAKKLAGLAGMSEEEYERRRAERMAGSPIAESIGTVTGAFLPALFTEGLSLGVSGAGTAATTAAKVAAATPVGLAMRAGRVAATGLERVLPAATTTGQAIARTGAQRALAGAVEGALWGTGTALQETATGQADSVAEALSAHLGPTTILFGALGGGLGILEAGLPAAVRTAGKVVDAAYERAPAFGCGRWRSSGKRRQA